MNSRPALLLVCMLAGQWLSGQNIHRYMVFFQDKAGTPYSLSSPLEFLSQKSLDRRAKHQVVLKSQDLPVNPDYVQALEAVGPTVYFTSKWMNAALVTMEAHLVVDISELPFVSAVEYIAPNEILSKDKVPFSIASTFTNPSSIDGNTSNQLQLLNADDMHQDGYDGSGVLVAVFDGGFLGVNQIAPFANMHAEGRVVAELDFVGNSGNPYQYHGHGTGVLSCIVGEYGAIFSGTGPGVDVILAVTEEVATEYRIEEYNWLLAAEYADSAGADIISSSLSYVDLFSDRSMDYPYEMLDGKSTVIAKAANWASDRGILVINSAGNSGTSGTLEECLDNPNNWCYIGSPADSDKVLTVGAVEEDGITKSSFTSFGPAADGRIKPDVSAKGTDVTVIRSTGDIIKLSGTSYSTPLMAGFAASIMQKYPMLTNCEMRDLLRSAGNISDSPNNEIGHGVPDYLELDTENLDDCLDEPYILKIDSTPPVMVYPNPFTRSLRFENLSETVHYFVRDHQGKIIYSGALDSSNNSLHFDASLASGLYFISLKSGSFSETIKLLKK